MARYPTIFSPGSLVGTGGGDSFLALHREMNRLFDDVLRGGAPGAQGRGQGGVMLAPHMDVSETDKEVRIKAELPGVTEKDIDVSLDDDVLTIRAEKRQERREEREGVHVSERAFGTFQRSIRLPFSVNADQVKAGFENGVLTVTLPKAQPEEKTRRIQVHGSQRPGGSGVGDGQSSAGRAAAMPETMSTSNNQPALRQGSSSGQPTPGFEDPLPPETDSKSGPGSSGPV